MKKSILLGAALLTVTFGYSQKKELRNISKTLGSGSVSEALSQLSQLEGSIGTADADQQAEFYLYKGQAHSQQPKKSLEDYKAAVAAFQKVKEIEASGKKKYTTDAETELQALRMALVTDAIEDQNNEKFIEASNKLYTSYLFSPRDTSDLYYAAGTAVNGGDYTLALTHYEKLMELGYTGRVMQYKATHKEKNKEETFSSKQERDIAVMSKEYHRAKDEMSESKRFEIYRMAAILYINQENIEQADKVVTQAKKDNPNDPELMQLEADIALKKGDMKTYGALVKKFIETDPGNPTLYFNLAVSAADIGERESALEYYRKAVQLNPDYTEAHINLAVLMLDSEKNIIDEMNNLGHSAADNRRYDQLKKERENLYRSALPHLEKAFQARNTDVDLGRTLMNMYSYLAEDAKFNAIKAKVESLEE